MLLFSQPLKAMVPVLFLLCGCETVNWYQAPPGSPTAQLGFYIDAPGAVIQFRGSTQDTCAKLPRPPLMAANLSSQEKKQYEQTLPIEANGIFVISAYLIEYGSSECYTAMAFRPVAGATYVASVRLDRYGEHRKCYGAVHRWSKGKYEQVVVENVSVPHCEYLKTK